MYSARVARSATRRAWAADGPTPCSRTSPCSTRFPTQSATGAPASTSRSHHLSRPPCDARRRRSRAGGEGRHHRPGRAGRAGGVVPALPRHRAGPAPPSGCGGAACGADHVVHSDPDNGHWGELAADRDVGGGTQASPDADGRVPLRGGGGGSPHRSPRRCGGGTQGHGAAARRGRDQRGGPHPDLVQGGRAGRLHRPHRRRVVVAGLAGGPGRHWVDRALDVLAAGPPARLGRGNARVRLEDYREAIETAIDRQPRTPSRWSSAPEMRICPSQDGQMRRG